MPTRAARETLRYDRPATAWTEALPVGNGRLGAMVFGGTDAERLQLNDITVWSGGPTPDADRADGYKALPEIRRLLRDGQYAAAEKLVAEHLTAAKGYFPSYQTLGDLTFTYRLTAGTVEHYTRSLDLNTGTVVVQFDVGGTRYRRETVASAADGVVVTRVGGSTPQSINFDLRLSRAESATTQLLGQDTLVLTGDTTHHAHPGGVAFEAQARVVTRGGTVYAAGDHVTVTNADEATIYLAAGTTYVLDPAQHYRGPDPHAGVERTLAAAAARPFEAIQKDVVTDLCRWLDRVDFAIDGPASDAMTDARLRAFGDGSADPALAQLYYDFGRYLLVCSSRPDNPLPSNSQGIWGDGFDLPWKCDYKSNINFQMNYWPAETANLGECHLPMIRLIRSLVTPGAVTAKAYFNAPGWVCAYTTNAFGWTTPGGGVLWGPFFGGSGWDCQHLWEHFAFGRDLDYLRSVYPTMKGACTFYLATLVPDANGKLVTSPSVSPENKFKTDDGVIASVCEGSAIEREIIWDLFTNTIQAAKILKTDDAICAELEKARAALRPLAIGKAGQLEEWGEDWDLNAPEPDHRHISHLFAMFPGRQITALGTPELSAAVRKSLQLRGDGGTGWAKAWKINLYARLRDGDHAYKLLCDQLVLATDDATKYAHGGGTYANLFDAHPPFQIDGNFGGVSGINEMLLQSHETYADPAAPDEDRYVIDLLPALPSAWAAGHINGLRARGGFTVDQSWTGHALRAVAIHSNGGRGCKVRYGPHTVALTLAPGETVKLNASLEPMK